MTDGLSTASRELGNCVMAVDNIRRAADETGQSATFLESEAAGIAAEVAAIRRDMSTFASHMLAA